jgi:hypothetical protein
VGAFLLEGDLAFVELCTEFHFLSDVANYFGQSIKKGESVIMTNWVLYNLDEQGKMKRIRVAYFRMHDPRSARL